MPTISIIVPVYKAEAFLHSCVDSILSQTFSDFEVILVDDGSPDNSGAICEEYAKADPRIRVLHQENQGQSGARNNALKLAEGEWICFVDSDDLIHPQMLELLYSAVQKTGAGVSMCTMVESPDLPENFFLPKEEQVQLFDMDDETLCTLFDRDAYPAWVACAKLIRKELIVPHPFCLGRVYEDNEAVCHWVCGAGQLAWMSHGLYFYRTNPQSTTQVSFSLKKLDYLWALEQIIRFYSAQGYEGMKERFTDLYAQELVNCCGAAGESLGRKTVLEIGRRGKRFLREEGLTTSLERREALLDVMHPKVMPLYWLLKGAISTIREEGLSGAKRKLRKILGKGETE